MRKAVFSLGKLPHFAESCFSSGQVSAFCGKLFFLWASFRKMRKAVFRLGGFPHFAESHFCKNYKTAPCGLQLFVNTNRILRRQEVLTQSAGQFRNMAHPHEVPEFLSTACWNISLFFRDNRNGLSDYQFQFFGSLKAQETVLLYQSPKIFGSKDLQLYLLSSFR